MNFPTIDRSFFAGECFDAYRVLGAHPCRDDFGQEGWRFAVWAPGAVSAATDSASVPPVSPCSEYPACKAQYIYHSPLS